MRGPRFGEASIGAVAGAVVGSIGGLFVLGIVRAIVARDITVMFGTPVFGFLSWLISLPAGWLGGGPRLAVLAPFRISVYLIPMICWAWAHAA